jgi:hypothetical protein
MASLKPWLCSLVGATLRVKSNVARIRNNLLKDQFIR